MTEGEKKGQPPKPTREMPRQEEADMIEAGLMRDVDLAKPDTDSTVMETPDEAEGRETDIWREATETGMTSQREQAIKKFQETSRKLKNEMIKIREKISELSAQLPDNQNVRGAIINLQATYRDRLEKVSKLDQLIADVTETR